MDVLSGLSIFVTVWCGLWVIPAVMMNRETRQFVNVINPKSGLYLSLLLLMNIAVVIPEHGFTTLSLAKVALLSLLPFASAFLMVRYYYSVAR